MSDPKLERATCWCIVINNPTEQDLDGTKFPAGWKLEGQMERGDETGTLHYQGMLKTPQVRWSAVKKVFPRARIEKARNPAALKNYSHKPETRVEEVNAITSSIPTMWDYQRTVASAFNRAEYAEYVNRYSTSRIVPPDEIILKYIDDLVRKDVEKGMRGVEFIAINPMWRASWKRFWEAIVYREQNGSQVSQDQGGPPDGAEGEEDDGAQDEVQGDSEC